MVPPNQLVQISIYETLLEEERILSNNHLSDNIGTSFCINSQVYDFR
jgi:hypothetical protein